MRWFYRYRRKLVITFSTLLFCIIFYKEHAEVGEIISKISKEMPNKDTVNAHLNATKRAIKRPQQETDTRQHWEI